MKGLEEGGDFSNWETLLAANFETKLLFIYIFIYWLIDWLIDWLTDWLIDWLIDWLNKMKYKLLKPARETKVFWVMFNTKCETKCFLKSSNNYV